jgi:hypothetical protein
MFADDMDSETVYVLTGTGVGFSTGVEMEAKCFGAYGRALYTRPATPAAGDFCQVEKLVTYPKANIVCCRMRVSIPDVSLSYGIYVTLRFQRGARKYYAQIVYLAGAKKLYYMNSAAGFTEIPGYTQDLPDGFWSMLQFIIDLELHQYLSVTFLGLTTSLAGIAIRDEAATTVRFLMFRFETRAIGAAQTCAWFDSLYIGEQDKI